jgi:hypothetical protein
MVAAPCPCSCQLGATTESYHVSVYRRPDKAGSCRNKRSQEAEPGSDEAAAALKRVGGGGWLIPLPRPKVVSKMWESIKGHQLQNPQNKREILADAKLQAIFGGKSTVSMFEMNKHLAQHLS